MKTVYIPNAQVTTEEHRNLIKLLLPTAKQNSDKIYAHFPNNATFIASNCRLNGF